jgi:hypothetical protein
MSFPALLHTAQDGKPSVCRTKDEQMATEKKSKTAVWIMCVTLALMVWAVFGQTITYGFVNYDDDVYVYENPSISNGLTLDGLAWVVQNSHGSNWHPLTSISHMLDAELYGMDAGRHHRTNVLLHGLNAILLFLVLRSLTGSFWKSAFVAAVFAIHPLRVESVAWISERKDVLSGLFFILTIGAYAHYAQRPFSKGRYGAVALMLTLGLLSKPMLVTMPFLLFLLDYWPLKRFGTGDRKTDWMRLVLEKIPLLLIVIAFIGATLWAQKQAITQVDRLPGLWRVGNAFCSCIIYIWQTLIPAKLAAFYPHSGMSLSRWIIGGAIFALTAISLAVFAGRKRYPYCVTGWLWYLGMLIPVLGIVQVGGQAHADRYTYLPQKPLSGKIVRLYGRTPLHAQQETMWRTIIWGVCLKARIGALLQSKNMKRPCGFTRTIHMHTITWPTSFSSKGTQRRRSVTINVHWSKTPNI